MKIMNADVLAEWCYNTNYHNSLKSIYVWRHAYAKIAIRITSKGPVDLSSR